MPSDHINKTLQNHALGNGKSKVTVQCVLDEMHVYCIWSNSHNGNVARDMVSGVQPNVFSVAHYIPVYIYVLLYIIIFILYHLKSISTLSIIITILII